MLLLGSLPFQQVLPAVAQVTSDGSFDTLVNQSATASCNSAVCTITGGRLNRSGSLLFHSFEQFSLMGQGEPRSALFIDPGVSDIIVRVTGADASVVDGTLATSPGSTANLFFLNPQGIRFGPNARLDLGGSFTASTANEVLFNDGQTLAAGSAIPASSALLTVSAPIGLGFLADAGSGAISVEGTGNLLTIGAPFGPGSGPDGSYVNRTFRGPLPPGIPPGIIPPFSDLAVEPGESIRLIGNGLSLDGANLTATGGQINLASVAVGDVLLRSPTSPPSATPSQATGTLDVSQVDTFADITLDQRASLEVSGSNPGTIQLRAQNIAVVGASAVLAETLPTSGVASPTATGGLIDLEAVDLIRVTDAPRGVPPRGVPPFFSYLSVDVAPEATGVGGQIDLKAQSLTVDNGGQLGANTFGMGDGGLIRLSIGENIALQGGGNEGPSGFFATATDISSGNAGRIEINARNFDVQAGAQVGTNSTGLGAAGSIELTIAERLSLVGESELIEILLPDGSTEFFVEATGIQSDSGLDAREPGGDIDIEAGEVLVADGAKISTATEGVADAGAITITADDIGVTGVSETPEIGSSLIATTTVGPGATGTGGQLTLNAERLAVTAGGQVATATFGPGQSGDLRVNSESVLIAGQGERGRSGLFTTALDTGDGGELIVDADTLEVLDGGTLSVSNFFSSPDARDFLNSANATTQGSVGDLTVRARRIALSDGAVLSAETETGDRGSIWLTTELLTLRNGSRITTNATSTTTAIPGGNITINAADGFVLAVPEENSDITANAVAGNGGQVNIVAQNVLGIETRAVNTAFSDITASSESGSAGDIQLTSLDTEVRQQATPLPQSTQVPAVAQGCSASSSRFVQTGRGGISTTPYGILNSRDNLTDVSLPSTLAADASRAELPPVPVVAESTTTESTTAASTTAASTTAASTTENITEAQGWSVNTEGDVVLLTADMAQAESERCLNWRT